MVTIELKTFIAAPPERVFDLSRSIDFHTRSMARSGEEAVAGRRSGLIGLGETVTWRARHLGVRQRLTIRISGYERPRWFRDELVRGAFATMVHDHHFDPADGGTEMRDVFRFSAPAGPVGRLVEWLLLERYMTRLLKDRNAAIKASAEGDECVSCWMTMNSIPGLPAPQLPAAAQKYQQMDKPCAKWQERFTMERQGAGLVAR